MIDFVLRFFICNLFVSGIIGVLLITKRILKKSLSSRMQYNLWFLLLGLLIIPFLPFRLIDYRKFFSLLLNLEKSTISNTGTMIENAISANPHESTSWINDYSLSVNSDTSYLIGMILLTTWIVGILIMTMFVVKSLLRIRMLKSSALPLQSQVVRSMYQQCLKDMQISREIPIYSTAFLKSPIFVGFVKPQIYLPIHLISDDRESDIRYMLLHELQHYKHKDALVSSLMNLASIIYWFNPALWYALREMRNDREVACDTSVLKMLEEDSYEDYGNTLINFAEKISLSSFPYTTGISSNMIQMKRRIMNIASYEKPTLRKKIQGTASVILISVLLIGLAPILSTYAADEAHYQWNIYSENVTNIDLSSYFKEYKGSFVLYDLKNDIWNIHDIEHATLRVAPNSTYKIYDALLGLEQSVITPEDSFIAWDGVLYPFEVWNTDQTLDSAMSSSVNWYFQSLDKQLGKSCISSYIHDIGYGNESINNDLFSYWMESSLKISPVEQVELLIKLHSNSFGFNEENINAVKNSIFLSSSEIGTFYGKTGTGRVEDQDVNGWFIGYLETTDTTIFLLQTS